MPFAIGIENNKTSANLGILLRSAYNFNASLIFTIGKRYKRMDTDTPNTLRHIPILHFQTWDDARFPINWIPIGIEITEDAIELSKFEHPRAAVYILGAEDGNLSKEALKRCKSIIYIPSKRCLNVAIAGSIVLYDRSIKRKEQNIPLKLRN